MTDELRLLIEETLRVAVKENLAFIGITVEQGSTSPISVFRNFTGEASLVGEVLAALAEHVDSAAAGGRVQYIEAGLEQ